MSCTHAQLYINQSPHCCAPIRSGRNFTHTNQTEPVNVPTQYTVQIEQNQLKPKVSNRQFSHPINSLDGVKSPRIQFS